MTRTVTGTFDARDQIENAREDLLATGIPQEKIYVLAPDATAREIFENLKRHSPTHIN